MAEKEYIEREALIENLNRFAPEHYNALVNQLITKQPAADVVEVRHEKWVDNHCTGCGMMPLGEEMWTRLDLTPPKFEWFMDFCPNCGADMKGDKK